MRDHFTGRELETRPAVPFALWRAVGFVVFWWICTAVGLCAVGVL